MLAGKTDQSSLGGGPVRKEKKERHFLDFTQLSSVENAESSEKKVQEIYEDKSVQEHTPCADDQPSTSFTKYRKIDWRIKEEKFDDIECSKQGSPRRRPRKVKLDPQSPNSFSKTEIRHYFSPESRSNSIEKQRVVEFLKPMRVEVPEAVVEHLSLDLQNIHINTIHACFDEDHPDFLHRGLEFLEDFLYKYSPAPDIVHQVLVHGLLHSRELPIMLKSYSILSRINQKYSGMIKVDWEMLKEVMDELCIGRGLFQQDPLILWLGSHFLKLFIAVLENELYDKDLTCQTKTTLAYKLLSYDAAYLNLKELVNWTVCSITCGEYLELIDERYTRIQSTNDEMKLKREDCPKILPLLQKLLALGINVSTSCKESSKVIASDLLKSYTYFPTLQHKKLLIETMKSDLLRYRFVTLVLERYSIDGAVICEFPMDIRSIVDDLFTARPPRYGMTPPNTPQSDDEGEGPPLGQDRMAMYPQGVIEEHVLLLYHVLQSHLHCTRSKSCTCTKCSPFLECLYWGII